MKKALTGEGMSLMWCVARATSTSWWGAADVIILRLNGDALTVNGANVLAFDADSIQHDIKMVQGAGGFAAGGMFNVYLQGQGQVAIITRGTPSCSAPPGPHLRRHRRGPRPGRPTSRRSSRSRSTPRCFHRQGFGRGLPDGLPGSGLGPRAAGRDALRRGVGLTAARTSGATVPARTAATTPAAGLDVIRTAIGRGFASPPWSACTWPGSHGGPRRRRTASS